MQTGTDPAENAGDGVPPAIEVCNIRKRFGDVTALDDLSFSVAPGELFFLLGPSGCGKTTMLRILAGLETPDSGTVRFDGEDVARRPPHERGAPMVFQNYALWPHLSVADNVAFGLVERRVARGERRARVRDALRRVGMEELAARRPGQLSGGQQQRVALARALVVNPSIILLDEPLSNLDARLRADMREELDRLHASSSIAFVYVTHDQVEALSLADRVAVMNRGRLAGLGRPADLYHRPPNTFCADFLGRANLVEGTALGPDGDWTAVRTPHGDWRAWTPAGGAPAAGSPVTLMIRPECLAPGPGTGGDNTFEAATCRVQLGGPTLTVDLRAGGRDWQAVTLSTRTAAIRPGSDAAWHARPADTVLLGG